MATKLFSGPVNHIDWNAESRILLVLGDDGTSQQTTKSMNFDTTVYTTPTSSLQPDRQNSFLSSLSPREKLSVSVRSGTSPVRMEPDGQIFSPHSVQSGSIAVTSVVASTYFHQSDHTSHATGTSASKSTMLNIQHATPKLCSPANSQSKGHFTPRAGHLTPRSSSNSVLDRLRYLEETMPLQNQHNSVTEGCIADLDKRIAHIDASIASAVNVVQIKFDRELETIRREHENR